MFDSKLERLPYSGIVRGAHVRSDPRSHAIDRLFFKRLWKLCRPYWIRKGAWGSIAALAGILSVGACGAAASGAFAYLTKAQTDALVAKQAPAYWYWFILATGLGLVLFLTTVLATYASGWLNLNWRRWLTSHLMDDYLAHRTYYEITMDEDIDNPDQRIQEQVVPFISIMSSLPQRLLNTSVSISVQVALLMSISIPMLVSTFIGVLLQSVIIVWVMRPTIRQAWDATVAEADFRYGLLHVRDNAETIAFYRGEKVERAHLAERLGTAIVMQARIIRYKVFTSLVDQGIGLGWAVLPMMLISPLYFEGKISYGTIGMATVAAAGITTSLKQFIDFIPQLSTLVPIAVRLAEIQEKFETLRFARQSSGTISRIARRVGPNVELHHCTLMTPRGEQTLIKDLSFVVERSRHLLILGQTGIGKSSLLRAIAGLWTRGSGTIVAPSAASVMFLPQRPYMILGTLRSQILYPYRDVSRQPTDQQLHALLAAVRLPRLVDTHGGLDAVNDWGRILSLGEQQRIAVARVLLAQPEYIFMDEATSAVDVEIEEHLYGLLLATEVTIISVGHRPSLIYYHENILDLWTDGWHVISKADYTKFQCTKPEAAA